MWPEVVPVEGLESIHLPLEDCIITTPANGNCCSTALELTAWSWNGTVTNVAMKDDNVARRHILATHKMLSSFDAFFGEIVVAVLLKVPFVTTRQELNATLFMQRYIIE